MKRARLQRCRLVVAAEQTATATKRVIADVVTRLLQDTADAAISLDTLTWLSFE